MSLSWTQQSFNTPLFLRNFTTTCTHHTSHAYEPYTNAYEPHTNAYEPYTNAYEPYTNAYEPYTNAYELYTNAYTKKKRNTFLARNENASSSNLSRAPVKFRKSSLRRLCFLALCTSNTMLGTKYAHVQQCHKRYIYIYSTLQDNAFAHNESFGQRRNIYNPRIREREKAYPYDSPPIHL